MSYALIDGHRPLLMDVHVPDGLERAPVVLWVQGGGWMSGDLRHVPLQWRQQRMFERLLDAGFAVATPGYRFIAEQVLPAPVHDLVAAVRYLRRYADDLGLDADRVAIWGDPSGGHLAAVAALAGSAPEPNPWLLGDLGVGTGRAGVQALVSWYGMSDLTVLPEIQEHLWPDASTEERPDLARRLSPVTLVRDDSPPMLVMHGDGDSIAPVDQAVRLAAAAQDASARCELVVLEGEEHAFLDGPIEVQWDRVIDFLRTSLGEVRRGVSGHASAPAEQRPTHGTHGTPGRLPRNGGAFFERTPNGA